MESLSETAIEMGASNLETDESKVGEIDVEFGFGVGRQKTGPDVGVIVAIALNELGMAL